MSLMSAYKDESERKAATQWLKNNEKLKSSSYLSKPVDVSIFIFESFVSQSNWKKWEDIGWEW